MPCFNAMPFLKEAVESILAQTFNDFELICVDDGSTDGTLSVLELYQDEDERVKIVEHIVNQGISAALNSGIAKARGLFIGITDADDISLQTRLEEQVRFLEGNPHLEMLGTGATVIGTDGKELFSSPFVSTQLGSIRFINLITSPFFHSSVMGKAQVFKKYKYSLCDEHKRIPDYELWCRMLDGGVIMSNIPEGHVLYRQHSTSFSNQPGKVQKISSQVFMARQLEQKLDVVVTPAQAAQLQHTQGGGITETKALFNQILKAYRQKVDCSPLALQEINQFIELSLCELSLKNLRAGSDVTASLHTLLKTALARAYFRKRLHAYWVNRRYNRG